jgi:glutamine amidotransferase-like uncharacterized protein
MSTEKVAFLWDESFLWGLMSYRTLARLGLSFELVSSEDICNGCLGDYKMLFVPGGWASNKSAALGESGVDAIKNFVSNGGSYLGFCGGAGLATKAMSGIGLLNVKRKPTKERVPSFSGRIELDIEPHPIWNSANGDQLLRMTNDEQRTAVFNAWWPSQFIIEDSNINILATYGNALPDSFSSDLNVGDVEISGNWKELEKIYQINLDPKRLRNEPAVIEGSYGKGRVILSLIHFDTPDDSNGEKVLTNIWEYLSGERCKRNIQNSNNNGCSLNTAGARRALPLQDICAELISLGERNFLWFWRNSMLLQWRRGIRGLEYNTLYIMMKEISSQSAEHRAPRKVSQQGRQNTDKQLDSIEEVLTTFIGKAKRLLILERHELQKGNFITYERCGNPEIKKIRAQLFSESKSHGGLFKELIDRVDTYLYYCLTAR